MALQRNSGLYLIADEGFFFFFFGGAASLVSAKNEVDNGRKQRQCGAPLERLRLRRFSFFFCSEVPSVVEEPLASAVQKEDERGEMKRS